MKKIGIFCGYFLPHLGGVERYTDKLSLALQKLGYEIVIVTSNHDNLPSQEVLKDRTIYRLPIHNIAKDRYPLPKTNREYKDLLHQIENEKIDYFLLNTRFHLTSLVGARLSRRQEKPVMLIEHGTDHFTVNNRVLDFFGGIYEHLLTSRIKKYVRKFYGVSKNCNVWLKHFSIQASGVFYNAIDTEDEKTVKDLYESAYAQDEVVIAYAGRLIKEKGILNLLEAFTQCKASNPNLKMKLVVAGSGDLLTNIQSDYSDPSIDIIGKLDFEHVMALYKRADIFVHPSLYPEGLPTAILEAGLMNCAVIATPRGGTEEVITDEQHGIIVDGSVESLRAAIEQLANDPAKRKSLGETIKKRIESVFSWDEVAKQVDQEIKNFKTE